jgi:hypothetical protein
LTERFVPRVTVTWLARMSPGSMFSVELTGRLVPAGNTATNVAELGCTPVTLRTTAVAFSGTWADRFTVMLVPPMTGPMPFRVSRTRTGESDV